MRVIKRDGREVFYDRSRIKSAVLKAMEASGDGGSADAEYVAECVENEILDNEAIGVEVIQDIVERKLMAHGFYSVAKAYCVYRDQCSHAREAKTNLMKSIDKIINADARNNNEKRENANIDGNTAMGAMLQIGAACSRTYNDIYLLRPEQAKAHREGDIHIHDSDFYALTTTCCQIDILKLFHGGFSTGHGFLREPQSIQSYAALAAIAIQANQNDQHGGQSIPNFDYGMAEGVAKSFRRIFVQKLFDLLDESTSELIEEALETAETISKEKLQLDGNKKLDETLASIFPDVSIAKVRNRAIQATERDTYQAMEGFVHNLNTMYSRAGAQVPFSSINYGTDTTPEGRMAIKNILLALEAGLGHGETCIFPIHIFKVKEGVNYNPGDPNYDLFKLSCHVSAKRLFPNYVFIDSPFNLQYYKPGHPETEVVAMGAVTGDDVITLSIDNEVLTLPFKEAYSRYSDGNHHVEILDRGNFVDVCKWHKYEDAGDWFDVIFDNGRYLRMTSDHPLPTKRGRVLCENLIVGDEVPISQSWKSEIMTEPPANPWLMGVLLCDGNRDCVISLGLDEKEIVERLKEICGSVKVKEQHRGAKGDYYDVRIAHGIGKFLPKKAMLKFFNADRKIDRILPPDFLSWSEENRLLLLAGLIDADGHINTRRGCQVQIGSTNKTLALEEMLLAESLGFHAKVYKTKYGRGDAVRYVVQFRVTKDIPLVCIKKRAKLKIFPELDRTRYATITSIEFKGHTNQDRYDVTTASDRFDVSGISSHNCRTRVMGNVYDPTKEIAYSRGNLSFTTINLPRLGIESYGNEAVFYDKLDRMLELVAQQLLDRFEIQASKHVYNYPFLMGQGIWLDSEKLNYEDNVREVLKHGTLSIGFIGLAETLMALYGEHHGQSESTQKKGLAIIQHMRDFCDKKSKELKMNFSLLATPAEGLSGRFVKMDRERYGSLSGITDKEYYTNSFHIPVWFPITAYEKIRIEAPYHEGT